MELFAQRRDQLRLAGQVASLNNTSQFSSNLQKQTFEFCYFYGYERLFETEFGPGNVSGPFRTILTSPRRNLQRRNNAIGKVINRCRSQLHLELV